MSIFTDIKKYRKPGVERQKRHDARAPKKGDAAPDFDLFDVNGENPVKLSDFKGQKPVVLYFGSMT